MAPSVTFVGALIATNGIWNYGGMLGIPGANAACNTAFAGSSHCVRAQIMTAAAAGELVGAVDTGANAVTSLWIDDPALPDGNRCAATTGSTTGPWEYGTGHLGCDGRSVTVNATTGAIGTVSTAACGTMHQVGCCM
jgi:hypothetical protein